MARTPLFSELARALRLARIAAVTRRPATDVVAEAADRCAARSIDRRALLTGAGATAGLAAIGPWAAGCRSFRPAPAAAAEVVVVGAGIAGLLCTHRLRQAGVAVRLVEAQERAGGRMWSLRDRFPDGQVVELGGELIDTGHTTMLRLVEELGLAVDDFTKDDPAVSRDLFHFGGARRSAAEVVAAYTPLAAAIERDLATLEDGDITYRTPRGASELDRLTLAEWLDRAGASGWMRDLLDVAYTTEYGLAIDRQSALNLLLLISPEPSPFEVFGDSDERFHLRGGNDLVTQALTERVGDALVLGHRLERLRQRADGTFGLDLRKGATSVSLTASQVVLALPFTLLRDVELDLELPAEKRRAIAELAYGTNSKLMISFAERLWRERHASNGSVLADLPFQLMWETSRLQPGRAGVLTNFTGGGAGLAIADGTAAAQAARVVGELETVFPGIGATRGEGAVEARMAWPQHPWVRGSYACYGPGQWTGFGGAEGESVGNLHFAGEHCSRVAQGFMEGGAETGEAAARAVLRALGRPLPAALAAAGTAALGRAS